MKILVVEDDTENMELFRDLLRSQGYTVLEARNGLDAIDMVWRERPNLVIMDIQLPFMDGLEATRRIKENPSTKDITIVAVTAYAMKGDMERFIKAGLDGYIAKPINIKEFKTVIARFLKGGVNPAPSRE